MSYLLERLSRELGTDAREEANRRHPELRILPDEHVEQLIDAVDYVMEYHGWPKIVENAERAYRALEANGELGRIAAQWAPAPAPEGFKPREDEDDFLRSGSLADVADYLRANFPNG
jgi:hypothetical protein